MEPTVARLYNPRVDQLRAVGFLAVAAAHFFVPVFNDALREGFLALAAEPLIRNGHFGVSLFFFLSGYILSRLATAQGGEINYKTFLINRLIRIYPLWLVCVAIVAFTHKLKGADVLALLGLFTQNLPPSPFNIAWSVQTEMYLYLMFPILFAALTWRRLAYLAGFLFILRAGMFFIDPFMLRDMSYSTVLGATTIFALGIMSGRTDPWNLGRYRLPLVIGAALIVWGVAMALQSVGGFHGIKPGWPARALWLFYPELMAAIFFLLVRSYDSGRQTRGLVGRGFAWVGKISYSGYLLHLFVLDFFNHARSLIGVNANGFIQFAVYLAILIPAASLSYKVVEEPFLKLRKKYVSAKPLKQVAE